MNKKEYRELWELIQAGFARTDELQNQMQVGFAETNGRLSNVEGRLSNLEGNFSRLVGHVADMRVEISDMKENMATKTDKDEVLSALDAYEHKADTYFQEHKILGGQVNRHQGWIEKIAKKIDLELDY